MVIAEGGLAIIIPTRAGPAKTLVADSLRPVQDVQILEVLEILYYES